MKEYFKSLDDSSNNNNRDHVSFTPTQVLVKVLLPDILYKYFYKYNSNTDEQFLYDSNVFLA